MRKYSVVVESLVTYTDELKEILDEMPEDVKEVTKEFLGEFYSFLGYGDDWSENYELSLELCGEVSTKYQKIDMEFLVAPEEMLDWLDTNKVDDVVSIY